MRRADWSSLPARSVAVRSAARDERDGVGVRGTQLDCVLDRHQPLVRVRHGEQGTSDGRLTRRGAAGDEDVQPLVDGTPEEGGQIARVDVGGECPLPLLPLALKVGLPARDEPDRVRLQYVGDVLANRE